MTSCFSLNSDACFSFKVKMLNYDFKRARFSASVILPEQDSEVTILIPDMTLKTVTARPAVYREHCAGIITLKHSFTIARFLPNPQFPRLLSCL